MSASSSSAPPIDTSISGRTTDAPTTTSATASSSMAPSTPRWPRHTVERISHGFQLSGMLQYYSALPLNITSGVTTIQGTAGRPIGQWRVHRAQCRNRATIFSASTPASAALSARRAFPGRGVRRGLQRPESPQQSHENGTFGAGAFPEPLAGVRADYRRERSEEHSVGAAVEFLTKQYAERVDAQHRKKNVLRPLACIKRFVDIVTEKTSGSVVFKMCKPSPRSARGFNMRTKHFSIISLSKR